MRIGFLTEYSEERVGFAKKAGFACLEVPVMPGTALDVRQLTKKEIESVREVFSQKTTYSSTKRYLLNTLK